MTIQLAWVGTAAVLAADDGAAAARAIHDAINQQRQRAGLRPLVIDQGLAVIAERHSEDMLRRRFHGHVNPDGRDSGDRIAHQHRRFAGTSGENIASFSVRRDLTARDAAVQFVQGWMSSPGHRRNILLREWNVTGVGVVRDKGEWRATQLFGELRATLNERLPEQVRGKLPDIKVKAAKDPAPTQVDLADARSGERVWGPAPLRGGDRRLPGGLGPRALMLRFYVPVGRGRWSIYPGPSVRIR